MLNILCFGDSITLGEKDLEQGGWADKLKKYYFNCYQYNPIQEVKLYNLGIGGETTDGLIKRFETEFNARRIRGQNTLVIFAYGANDIVIHKNKNIVPDSYFIRNLTNCIKYALANASQVLLLSLLPISENSEAEINIHGQLRFDRDIKKYNKLIENLAIEKACFYIDLYNKYVSKSKEKLLSADGIHPNSNGHQLVFEQVKNKLLEMTLF